MDFMVFSDFKQTTRIRSNEPSPEGQSHSTHFLIIITCIYASSGDFTTEKIELDAA